MTRHKLYSYVRWSSDRQAKGTSLERQTNKAKEFATLHNLELVELLDAGLSAYRGKNTTQGRWAASYRLLRAESHRKTATSLLRTSTA